MRRLILASIILYIIIITTCGEIAKAEELSYNENWDYGVVVVLYGSQYGTGFWVSKNWIVTAGHVVSFQSYAKVQLIHGDFETYGTVVYVDQQHDVAIIKAEDVPARVHYFKISVSIEKGMKVYAIGYPYELYVLYGDVKKMSANPRAAEGLITWIDYEANLAEIQATIDQGNSGGPVISSSGAVVGLVSFAMSGEVGTLYFVTTCDAIRSALSKAGASYQLDIMSSITSSSSGSILLGALAGAMASFIVVMLMMGARRHGR